MRSMSSVAIISRTCRSSWSNIAAAEASRRRSAAMRALTSSKHPPRLGGVEVDKGLTVHPPRFFGSGHDARQVPQCNAGAVEFFYRASALRGGYRYRVGQGEVLTVPPVVRHVVPTFPG